MKLTDLILEFAALADARLTGNALLIQRQHKALTEMLQRLPEELPERPQPPTNAAPESAPAAL